MNRPYKIFEGQFYMTNVCNLTCDGCISFNNRKFKGHFYWKDYEKEYTEWNNKLDINSITIIGGEPFSNPDLINWVTGLKNLWSDCNDKSICTNGTYIFQDIKLLQEIFKNNFWLDICLHDPKYYKDTETQLIEEIKKYFNEDPKIESDKNKDRWSPDLCKNYFIKGKKVAMLSKHFTFSNAALRKIQNGKIYMHDSDPIIAHENCGPKYCHYFVRGNLYKCYLTAIHDDLIDQFNLEERAAKILKNYQSCNPWMPDIEMKKFFNGIMHPIEQCKLCPESSSIKPIWPLKLKKENL